MNSWAPLFCGLVDSSIWEEEDHVFRVFMAMMSLKDHNHVVSMDGFRLAKRIHMPVEKVLDALKVLAEPDRKRPGQEFDGRRIEATEDGWLILKGQHYRDLVSLELRRAKNRRSQQAFRDRKKANVPRGTGAPLPGERAALAAEQRGDYEGAAAIAAAALPESVSISAASNEEAKGDMASKTPQPGGADQPGPEKSGGSLPSGESNAARSLSATEVESGSFVDGVWVPD